MENSVNLSVVPTETLKQLQSEISEIKNFLLGKKESEEKDKWLSKKEARIRLKVCQKTLDTYLSKGVLPYSRFAGKIYVKVADIEAHLQNHYISRK
jgi:hypothetical protein